MEFSIFLFLWMNGRMTIGTRRRNPADNRSGPLHFDGENHGPQYGIKSQSYFIWDTFLLWALIHVIRLDVTNWTFYLSTLFFVSFFFQTLLLTTTTMTAMTTTTTNRKLWWITPCGPYPTLPILEIWLSWWPGGVWSLKTAKIRATRLPRRRKWSATFLRARR